MHDACGHGPAATTRRTRSRSASSRSPRPSGTTWRRPCSPSRTCRYRMPYVFLRVGAPVDLCIYANSCAHGDMHSRASAHLLPPWSCAPARVRRRRRSTAPHTCSCRPTASPCMRPRANASVYSRIRVACDARVSACGPQLHGRELRCDRFRARGVARRGMVCVSVGVRVRTRVERVCFAMFHLCARVPARARAVRVPSSVVRGARAGLGAEIPSVFGC